MPFGKPSSDVDAWRFPARITADQVVDGDTTDAVLDLGFHTRRTVRLRLYGVDTAEIYGTPHDSDEFILGTEQTEFVEAWVADAVDDEDGWPFDIWTLKAKGKYGRFIADVARTDTGESLSTALIDEYGKGVISEG